MCEAHPALSEKYISFELRSLSHQIKRYVENSQIKQYADKMTGVHGWILGYLYDNRNRDVYQRDIEEKFNIRRSSVSSLLGLMEQNGLIIRQPVEHDARLKKIVMTDKAYELQKMIQKDFLSVENMLKEGLSDEEINAFFATMSKMKHNLEKKEGKLSDGKKEIDS